ncbi:MAG: glucosamine-6-phosphate isomerase [Phycisphaeraceae bacterium]|nr:glucosamine-6-phosphate isomerase [Phycisphaeraceae bacterium]
MSSFEFPDYLEVERERLGKGTPVAVDVIGDMQSVAQHFAEALYREIESRPDVTMILPVGPVDQFPLLAAMINARRLDCRRALIINMDEYLDEYLYGVDRWVDRAHPLSFRGYMDRLFYDRIAPDIAPPPAHRVFPDPADPGAIAETIERRGGVDVCYGGIGINGHIAFNEPPEPDEPDDVEEFAARPTRVLTLSRETRTINSNTVGGEISIIPTRAITVGMREILAAERIRLYCNRPWQAAVIRRVLHGPVSARCPTSLVRNHPDAAVTIADYVAEPPDIRLR